MIQVLRTRSLPCPTCLLQYPCGCTHALTWWDALPVCLAHNSTTAYLPQWSTCYSWLWPSGPACLPKCSKPWLSSLLTESPLFAGQSVSVLNDARCLWLPATVIHSADHGSYLIKVIGGGQYQHACDHICECHPDAIKPDKHVTTSVAPATPTHLPATQAVQPAPCIAPATPQPAAIPHTLQKTPTVHMPYHAQSVTPRQTSTAPAVPCHSAWNSKPPSWLIEEM